MKLILTLLVLLNMPAVSLACPESLNFSKRQLAGDKMVDLCKTYAGKVVLIVNTASKCGYTYQYEGLEAIYRKYLNQGLVVLGFPRTTLPVRNQAVSSKYRIFAVTPIA